MKSIVIVCLVLLASCDPVKTGPFRPGKAVVNTSIGHIKMCANKETRVEALCARKIEK